MGFHKRFITRDGLIAHYNNSGIDGIKQYYSADALIIDMQEEKLSEIHNLLFEREFEKIENIVKDMLKE